MAKLSLIVSVIFTFVTIQSELGQATQQGISEKVNVRIVGRLLDFNDVPISNARIGIAPANEPVWRPLTTSSRTGVFEIRIRLQPGAYSVIAAFGQYEVAHSDLEIRASIPVYEVTLRAIAKR